MIGSDDWYDGSIDTSSDDWYDGSTDTGSDDEPDIPTSDLTVLISGQNVIFNGTGDGTENTFVLNSNILTNPNITNNCRYIYSSNSKIDTTGVSILPKFVIEEADETVIDIVDSFNMADYPTATIVKAVYIYKINTNVSLYLKPEVYADIDITNAIYSPTITEQIKNAKEDANVMTGATDSTDGTKGNVPAPKAGDNHKFFKGDGSYSKVNLAEEVNGILSVKNGGTGASESDDALINLNAVRDDIITTNKETTDISSRLYAIGDQFIFNNVLYTVTQTIAIGDQLVVGTNIKNSDSLTEQIASKSSEGGGIVISYADYLLLTPEEQTNGDWYIPDYPIVPTGFDDNPTTGSVNPVTSGGIKAAIDNVSEAINTKLGDLTEVVGNKVSSSGGETGSTVTTFTSLDNSNTTDKTDVGITSVATLTSGETHQSLFGKISGMFKNIRKLWNTVGTTSLASGKTLTGLMGSTAIPSSLGTTVTGAINSLNSNYTKFPDYANANIVDQVSAGSTYTPTSDGFFIVMSAFGANNVTTSLQVNINDVTVCYVQNSTLTRVASPLFPVKKGDTINIMVNNPSGFTYSFIPFR